MSAPQASEPQHRKPRRFTPLQKISAAAGVAVVGVAALSVGLGSGQGEGEVRVAGGDLDVKPVAWRTAQDSPEAQKKSVEEQSARAGQRERAEAEQKAEAEAAKKKAALKRKAEATKRAADARRAEAAEKRRKAEAARAARAKATAERARKNTDTASRSAQRPSPSTSPSATSSPSAAPAAPSGSPQKMARQIIGDQAQFQCFSQIVERESGWRVNAENAGSGAYGLVQALPGSKMASAGADWRTNPATQIKWGLSYMKSTYGSPCGAWSFWQANHWY